MPTYPIARRKYKIVIQERIYCIQHFKYRQKYPSVSDVAILCASMTFPALVLTLYLKVEIDRALRTSIQVVPHL
jgi:hypothetical protein